jgi:hypothetical protein
MQGPRSMPYRRARSPRVRGESRHHLILPGGWGVIAQLDVYRDE